MRRALYWATCVVAVAIVGASCGHRVRYPVEESEEVYTLTNLHPDEGRGRLYSVNYQQDGLIKVCSPVRIEEVSAKRMTFTVLSTGRRYEYIFHRMEREPVEQHIGRYFGPRCPTETLQGLDAADVAGVQQGHVYQGMTRQGVILAVGYPPARTTPTLDSDVWRYWTSRFNSLEVYFQNGRVVGIRN